MNKLPEQFQQLIKEPYAPLLPWGALALLLFLIWYGVQSLAVDPAQVRVTLLETEWNNARQVLFQRQEARQTRQDLNKFMAALPTNYEFAPLALAISEEAKKYGVKLPALTYRLDKAEAGLATKALFQGTATGRYEDLRRFVYHLETFKQLLLVEDMTVLNSNARSANAVTVNLQIATYLRGGTPTPPTKAGAT